MPLLAVVDSVTFVLVFLLAGGTLISGSFKAEPMILCAVAAKPSETFFWQEEHLFDALAHLGHDSRHLHVSCSKSFIDKSLM